jgi:hypothetical protein
MHAPRATVSKLVVAGGFALLAMLAAGCESSAPAQTGLSKPSSASKAVSDAVARTATFKDLKYNVSSNYNSATNPNLVSSSVLTATTNPVRVHSVSTTNGKRFENIQDGAKQVFCTMPEGGPNQQFPANIAASNADPFSGLAAGLNWKYLADTTLNGRPVWHLMSDFDRSVTGNNPNHIVYDVATKEIWIDSQTGKILKRFDHNAGSENSVHYDQTITDDNFVYNSGITVPGCP